MRSVVSVGRIVMAKIAGREINQPEASIWKPDVEQSEQQL